MSNENLYSAEKLVGLLNNLTNSKKEKELSVYIAIKIPVLITATHRLYRMVHFSYLIVSCSLCTVWVKKSPLRLS